MQSRTIVAMMVATIAIPFMSNSAQAQYCDWQKCHYWNAGVLENNGYYDGFWLSTTLPTLNPAWSSGEWNKINFEFWFNVDGSSGNWVEMGYHNGYGYTSNYGDSDPDLYKTYNGLFTAKQLNGAMKIRTFPNRGWNAGQYHTMGTSLVTSSSGNYAEMRSDNSVVTTYPNTTVGWSPVGYSVTWDEIHAGFEWSWSKDHESQSVTSPSNEIQMNNLHVHNSYGWHTFESQLSNFKLFNDSYQPPFWYASFKSGYNSVSFFRE